MSQQDVLDDEDLRAGLNEVIPFSNLGLLWEFLFKICLLGIAFPETSGSLIECQPCF